MKEFSAGLLEPFGLRVRRFARSYGAFICETNQGTVLVKETEETEGSLWFTHGLKEYLAQRGFGQTDRFLLHMDGRPWAEENGEAYTVRLWMRADEANLEDTQEVVWMAALLGQLHSAQRGFGMPAESSSENRCFAWPARIDKSCRRLHSYSKMLRKNGRYTEFDLMVLSCLPEHLEQAEAAQDFFMSQTYSELAERMDREMAVAHGRFADHAVLLAHGGGKAGQSLVTEFDQAAYAIETEDLITLMEKALRKNDWSISLGVAMLEAYDRWHPMDEGERQMVYAGLLFPERLSNLCKEAYHTRRSWMPISYKKKLEELLAQQKKRKDFLDELACILR